MSFDAFDISATGLYAQRLKMDTIASNIANINTTRNPDGSAGPYVRKQVVFSSIYDKMTNEPETSSSGVNPVYSVNKDEVVLKGRVDFDSPMISKGVSVAQIAQDKDPYKMIYNPSHPDADKDGFVKMPNINVVTEMVDMMIASRSYEANVTSVEASKSMINSAMKI